MDSIQKFIKLEINELKKENLYRRLRIVENQGAYALVNNNIKAINYNSNDYLGLSSNQEIIKKTAKCFNEISQCSSRLIGGNNLKVEQLEDSLSKHRRTESSLVYSSGYSAVLGVLSSLADNNTTIFSDDLNHASIIDGCRLSGAKIKVFRHNDARHLLEILDNTTGKKILVTEGVFSIEGDISDLKSICKIAREYGVFVIIDDAHGDFVFGRNGSGIPFELKVNNFIDIHISSLSKALGCFGGYVACSNIVRDFLINKSRQLIFTSALPTHLCVSALNALKITKKGTLQKKLFKNMKMLHDNLIALGFNIGRSRSQIIPIHIGPEHITMKFAELLMKKRILVHPMRFPTVKKGSALLRLSLSTSHNQEHLLRTLDELENIGKKLRVI